MKGEKYFLDIQNNMEFIKARGEIVKLLKSLFASDINNVDKFIGFIIVLHILLFSFGWLKYNLFTIGWILMVHVMIFYFIIRVHLLIVIRFLVSSINGKYKK
ncbi:hypothetical protein IKC_04217 [Bacillus cereus VD184]|uniref:Uncharacterized protein n=2 Tax=Bacillus cereus group TaxID=86661 RepID=A0A9W5VV38_BACCE|nr:hypothetical protein IKC_04217 [Bacillus cereus VD184]